MKAHYKKLTLFAFGVALASAGCDSDDTQDNPNYSTGGTRTTAVPEAGENGFGFSGQNSVEPTGGTTSKGGANASGGKQPTASGGEPGSAGADASGGAGGSPNDVPPYDCVLRPKTHLEIINACTDATRIEKHPVLPAIP